MAGFFALLLPPFTVEIITESLYFSQNTSLYFFFSGLRLYFFIIYLGIVAFILGRRLRSLRVAWFTGVLGVFVIFLLLYRFGCNPTLCYDTGMDGLEPLREYSFFLSEVIVLSAVGFSTQNTLSRRELLISNAAAFFAISYYPIAFTIAGTQLVSDISPLPVLTLTSLLSLTISGRVIRGCRDLTAGFLIPITTFLAVTAILIGIASQYVGLILPVLGLLFTSVVAASLLGSLMGGRNGVRKLAVSKAPIAVLVILVFLTIVLIPPDAVSGAFPSGASGSYTFGTPVVTAGFSYDPYLGTRGVSANFSFAGTVPSSIQPDNLLGAWMGVHSPDCCIDGIDYGLQADVFLYHNGGEVFAASAWQACDIVTACGGHTWKRLMYFSSTKLDPSADFRLTMVWVNHTVQWSIASAKSERVVASFDPPQNENRAFGAGWLPAVGWPSGYPFFEFGVMSAYPIGQPGWKVEVSCPSTIVDSTWRCISHAGLIQGDYSFWKFIWRWGENYPNVGVAVDPGLRTLTFQYSTSSFTDLQRVW